MSRSEIAQVGSGVVTITITGAPALMSKQALLEATRLSGIDREAYSKLLIDFIAIGQAELLVSGQSVEVIESSTYNGIVKIRLAGDYKEYWTLGTAVKN